MFFNVFGAHELINLYVSVIDVLDSVEVVGVRTIDRSSIYRILMLVNEQIAFDSMLGVDQTGSAAFGRRPARVTDIPIREYSQDYQEVSSQVSNKLKCSICMRI